MKTKLLKDFAPILVALGCAAVVGALLLSGVVDLDAVPALVKDNRVLAIAVVMALFIVKGFSGVIIYNVLIVVVSLIFPLWEALIINAVGTAVALSISYMIGSFTKTQSIEQLLEQHPKIKKYFTAAQRYGFVSCLAIHLVGLNMEVLGILFGMLRIGFVPYLVSSWLGIIPGMICFVIAGSTRSLRSPALWIVLAVDLIMMALAFLYTRRKMQREEKSESAKT